MRKIACLSRMFLLAHLMTVPGPVILAKTEGPHIHFGHDFVRGEIVVQIRGEHFTTYHYGQEARTPFLWPIHSAGEVGVTRNFPMGLDEPPSRDHPHHRSLYLTYGDVNGYDHWHKERIDTLGIQTGEGHGYAWIRAENAWLTTDGGQLLRERQELRFYDTPATGRYFDIISTLQAAGGDVTFGDDKEGLLAFRIRPDIQGDRGGVLTNASGRQGEKNVYGTPSPWMDYSGLIPGHGMRGMAVFDHPDNFRHPTYWHVRDYGLAAANPFGRRSVGGEPDDGSHQLRAGNSMTFVYRIYVHSGDVEEAGVARQYEDFASKSYDPGS